MKFDNWLLQLPSCPTYYLNICLFQIVVEAGRSFTVAAEEEAARLSPDCSRQVRTLTKDLDMAGSDLMSVAVALRKDQSVALRTALRDACFSYNLVVMKVG